jgi:hypothetical protein
MRLEIDRLQLKFEQAAGHEHRVRPVTLRALELLRLRLRNELPGSGARLDGQLPASLRVEATEVNLAVMSDESAAEKLADAMFSALWARRQEG